MLQTRKLPRQARAIATVEAIFAATVQLLEADGRGQLTTTRISQRAGVSVGTMYQYFPNKQSLLYALLDRHLAGVSLAMEKAARQVEGQAPAEIARALAKAWIEAKTGDPVTARAIYAVAADFDVAEIVGRNAARVETAIVRTLTGTAVREPETAAAMLVLVMGGAVRAALERDATAGILPVVQAELPDLCAAYLCSLVWPGG